jgi:hypothetical protein
VHTFHLALPVKPRWLSFDPGNWILKKLQLKVPKDMLIAQLQHDPDVMGRIYAAEALGELGSLEAVASLRQVLEQIRSGASRWRWRASWAPSILRQRWKRSSRTCTYPIRKPVALW